MAGRRIAGACSLFPLFERLKATAPEFEQLTAFQAGGLAASVRRPGIDTAARALRSEYVTGNYFTTFGISAFGGRVFTAEDDKPSSPPVVVLSHHAWQATYGGEKSMVGATLVIEGHPFTVPASPRQASLAIRCATIHPISGYRFSRSR